MNVWRKMIIGSAAGAIVIGLSVAGPTPMSLITVGSEGTESVEIPESVGSEEIPTLEEGSTEPEVTEPEVIEPEVTVPEVTVDNAYTQVVKNGYVVPGTPGTAVLEADKSVETESVELEVIEPQSLSVVDSGSEGQVLQSSVGGSVEAEIAEPVTTTEAAPVTEVTEPEPVESVEGTIVSTQPLRFNE